jgi:1-acyl-sn-glycerol-3-phosphate acyltransferase
MTSPLTGAIRAVIDRIFFWMILANLAISCIGWSLPALPLNSLLPKRVRPRVGQFTAMFWCRYFIWSMQLSGRVRCDLTALDTLRNEQHLIIVPNHPSMLDALLVISRLPHVTCIAKASLWNNLFFGAGIRLAGYIRNDTTRQLLRDAADVLAQPGARQMLIFPEGTRSVAGSLSPFRPGFAAIARRAGAVVQTVLIENNTPYLGKSWSIFRQPAFPLDYRIRLGRRFTVSGSAQEFTAMLERYFREELAMPALEAADRIWR